MVSTAGHQAATAADVVELGQAVRRLIAESREIVADYRAASLAYRRAILRNRRLREELRAEHARLRLPGPSNPS